MENKYSDLFKQPLGSGIHPHPEKLLKLVPNPPKKNMGIIERIKKETIDRWGYSDGKFILKMSPAVRKEVDDFLLSSNSAQLPVENTYRDYTMLYIPMIGTYRMYVEDVEDLILENDAN